MDRQHEKISTGLHRFLERQNFKSEAGMKKLNTIQVYSALCLLIIVSSPPIASVSTILSQTIERNSVELSTISAPIYTFNELNSVLWQNGYTHHQNGTLNLGELIKTKGWEYTSDGQWINTPASGGDFSDFELREAVIDGKEYLLIGRLYQEQAYRYPNIYAGEYWKLMYEYLIFRTTYAHELIYKTFPFNKAFCITLSPVFSHIFYTGWNNLFPADYDLAKAIASDIEINRRERTVNINLELCLFPIVSEDQKLMRFNIFRYRK